MWSSLVSSKSPENLTPSNANPKLRSPELNLPHIPEEIQLQIILKLPVKSLLRFKSVSKSWFSLISDPKFIKSHLNQSLTDQQRLFLIRIRSNYSVSFTSVSYESNESQDVYNPIIEEPRLLDYAMISGSCNGLLLMRCASSLYIWNPSTREYKKISLGCFMANGYALYGFGYDSYVDDYKVVVVGHKTSKFEIPTRVVYVYSLKTDSFVLNDGFHYKIYSNATAVICNENPHWLVRCDMGEVYDTYDMSKIIICFDFRENEFKEIRMANCGFHDESPDLKLGVMEESLCMSCNYKGSHFELWVMKEYGVDESWTKLFVVSHLLHLQPFAFTKNSDVLMQIGENVLGVYDIRRNLFRNILFPNNDKWFPDSILYTESLVSPANSISGATKR